MPEPDSVFPPQDDPASAPLISEAKPETVKTGPPRASEWQDFFSRVVLRLATEWYLNYAFRNVDEDLVEDSDLARLQLTPRERDQITAPLAEWSSKNKWTRKHGREIISTAYSLESLIILATWVRRVNRVAARYPQKINPNSRRRRAAKEATGNGDNGPSQEQGSYNGTTGGKLPPGFPVFGGS